MGNMKNPKYCYITYIIIEYLNDEYAFFQSSFLISFLFFVKFQSQIEKCFLFLAKEYKILEKYALNRSFFPYEDNIDDKAIDFTQTPHTSMKHFIIKN